MPSLKIIYSDDGAKTFFDSHPASKAIGRCIANIEDRQKLADATTQLEKDETDSSSSDSDQSSNEDQDQDQETEKAAKAKATAAAAAVTAAAEVFDKDRAQDKWLCYRTCYCYC